MSEAMPVIITITVFIVFAILYAVLCTRYRERWCAREGFENLGKVSNEWYLRLRGLQENFGAGDVGHVGSCLRKVIDGRTLWLLEHEWRTGSAGSLQTNWKTFVIWELDESELPPCSVRRKASFVQQAFANVLRAILFLPYLLFLRPQDAPAFRLLPPAEKDDTHEFSEEFARLYQVTGDAEATRKLVTRDIQASLCEHPLTGDLVVIDRLLIWQAPGLLTPWSLDEKHNMALLLRQLFLR